MQNQEKKNLSGAVAILLVFVALTGGFILGRLSSPVSRYQLVVLPAAPGSQIDLDRLYRLDRKTGQIDWLAANIAGDGEKTRTIMSWPAPSK